MVQSVPTTGEAVHLHCMRVRQRPRATAVLPKTPQPLRIEPLTPLVAVQPVVENRKDAEFNNPQEQPAPKDTPLDDWREFDNSWMETPYEIERLNQ